MPKKFQGENSKAVTARARKAEAKAVADARKKQQEEDALWQETDKHVLKKEQRKVSWLFSGIMAYALLDLHWIPTAVPRVPLATARLLTASKRCIKRVDVTVPTSLLLTSGPSGCS